MLRYVILLGLLGVACTDSKDLGDDPDVSDTEVSDTDPTTGTDSESEAESEVETDKPAFEEYDSVTSDAVVREMEFDGGHIRHYIPDDPVAIVYLFHGTGGNADFVDNVEMVAILNEFIARDIAFVSLDSANRAQKVWNTQDGVGANEDWERLVSVRGQLIASRQIRANLASYGWGYSNGGNFCGWWAHTAEAEGWPVEGMIIHQATGRSGFYGAAPGKPGLWIGAVNDDTVTLEAVQAAHDAHVEAGHEGVMLIHQEQRLAPTRFARSPHIGLNASRELFDEAIDLEFFDACGERLFSADAIETNVDAFAEHPDTSPERPTRSVLNVVLATHSINGEYAVEEADFISP